jgi:hypothetical protein
MPQDHHVSRRVRTGIAESATPTSARMAVSDDDGSIVGERRPGVARLKPRPRVNQLSPDQPLRHLHHRQRVERTVVGELLPNLVASVGAGVG